jgi:hypothetical protein
VTAARVLTEAGFGEALATVRHTAFRLELQDAYAEPCEAGLLAAFLGGDPPPATTVPELRAWYGQVAAQVRDGKRIGRVRVQQEPPTRYQEFERWLDQWGIPAGEDMRYLTRRQAHRIGLLPAAGDLDWWLLDSARLIVMSFGEDHRRAGSELVTDPAAVLQACMWRDLAVHHAAVATVPGVAA